MGDREWPAPGYDEDRTSVIRTHLESLERLAHDLDQVTLVVSGIPDVEKVAMLIQPWAPSRLRGACVHVMFRPNLGMSYGAFSDAFTQFRDDFDHFIFTEDDYLFTQDHFDARMQFALDGNVKGNGFICGASYKAAPDPFDHAAVFIGMASTEALAAASKHGYPAMGRLFYDETSPIPRCGFHGQKGMSKSIIDAGYTIDDWLTAYSTAYWDSEHGIVRWFSRDREHPEYGPQIARGDLTRPSFVVPVQALGRTVRVSDGHEWHEGTISSAGVFTKAAR